MGRRFVLCGHCQWGQHGISSYEQCCCHCHPRQRRNKKRPSGAGRARVVELLRNRDGNLCHWCRIELKHPWRPTIEHLIPKAYGGGNNLENLVLACDWCNSKRGTMPPWEFRLWLQKNWVEPSRRKVRLKF